MTKLRSRLSYANVMSTLAVFLLVAGGGAYAAGKLRPNSVKSKHIAPEAVKGDDAAEATFGKVPTATAADTASGVTPDAVGAAGIQNPSRSLNLPLTSLVLRVLNSYIDFTPSDGTEPDFLTLSGPQLTIEWDDDTDGVGANVADNASVGTTFVVPPDYASNGRFVPVISKDAHSGIAEFFKVFVQTSAGSGASEPAVTITSAASTAYILNPFGGGLVLNPGDAVWFQVRADANSGFGSSDAADNIVYLEGLEFRYTATQ